MCDVLIQCTHRIMSKCIHKQMNTHNNCFFVHQTKLGLAWVYSFAVLILSLRSKQLRPLEFSDRHHGACCTSLMFCRNFYWLPVERRVLRNCVRKLFCFFTQQSPCLIDTYKMAFCIRMLVGYLYCFSSKTLYNTSPLNYKVSA